MLSQRDSRPDEPLPAHGERARVGLAGHTVNLVPILFDSSITIREFTGNQALIVSMWQLDPSSMARMHSSVTRWCYQSTLSSQRFTILHFRSFGNWSWFSFKIKRHISSFTFKLKHSQKHVSNLSQRRILCIYNEKEKTPAIYCLLSNQNLSWNKYWSGRIRIPTNLNLTQVIML